MSSESPHAAAHAATRRKLSSPPSRPRFCSCDTFEGTGDRMNRRYFLNSAAAGTIALNAFPHHLFASEAKKYPTDRVKLGSRQVEVSRFAQGAGTDGAG